MIYIIFMCLCVIIYINNFIISKKNCCIICVNKTYRIRKDQYYCFLMTSLLFLIAALRAPSVGFDTIHYCQHFYNVCGESLKEIIQKYEEPGFYLLCKAISTFSDNAQWMLAVVGLIFTAAIGYFIYKYSSEYMASFLILIPFQFYSFSLTGLRQTLALSLVLYSYKYIEKKEFLKFTISILVAMTFHYSAIFAFPLYFIYKFRINNLWRSVIVLMLPVLYIFRSSIIRYGLKYLYTDYNVYSDVQGSYVTFALYLAICIIYKFVCDKKYDDGFEAI